MTGLKSPSAAELRLLCFQDIIQIPFSSSIIWDQRCCSNPDVDENLNSEMGFGQSFSTFDQNYYFKNFCSEVIWPWSCPNLSLTDLPDLRLTQWVLFTCVWAALCLSAPQPCWAWRAVPYSLGAAVLAITAHGAKAQSQAVSSQVLLWQLGRK